jgi:hypothetical protein
MTLVNLPSAVRIEALARTPVATLDAVFGRLTATFAFVAYLLVFMIASLFRTGGEIILVIKSSVNNPEVLLLGQFSSRL